MKFKLKSKIGVKHQKPKGNIRFQRKIELSRATNEFVVAYNKYS